MSILSAIYNAFDPAPLPAGSKFYVDCKAVRGDSDVLVELGRTILLSQRSTCQLYTGHRGGGKSTELQRLKQYLEQEGCTVIYFSAEDEDVNPEDVEYTDILMACARHLLEGVKNADQRPVLSWLRERAQALKEVLFTEISVTDPEMELGFEDFAKITAGIRTQPTQRAELRKQLNPHTETLVKALNEFIDDAKRKLPPEQRRLVLIADGLEKITLITKEGGRTNHDEIFIDRAEQLKALTCDVIYTVPVSLALSCRASDLMDIYGCEPQVLPMVMVQTQKNKPHDPGVKTLEAIVAARLQATKPGLGLAELFDNPETLRRLCLMSGGHVRNLVRLVQVAIKYNPEESLPITASAVQQAIRQMRKTYRDTVNADQWDLLAAVYDAKKIPNDDIHRSLLFTRCLLEYLEEECWHDVHPLLLEVSEFKAAWNRRQEGEKT
jgi:hypothetical protein